MDERNELLDLMVTDVNEWKKTAACTLDGHTLKIEKLED